VKFRGIVEATTGFKVVKTRKGGRGGMGNRCFLKGRGSVEAAWEAKILKKKGGGASPLEGRGPQDPRCNSRENKKKRATNNQNRRETRILLSSAGGGATQPKIRRRQKKKGPEGGNFVQTEEGKRRLIDISKTKDLRPGYVEPGGSRNENRGIKITAPSVNLAKEKKI